MKRLYFLFLLLLPFIGKAQIKTAYSGITAFHTDLLIAAVNNPKLLPIQYSENEYRYILNHQIYFQHHWLVHKRIEINLGLGINYQFYSSKSEVKLDTIKTHLKISRPLLPEEKQYNLHKLRRHNFYVALPIGLKFFFKKDETKLSQPAFSIQFLTERKIFSGVNPHYATDIENIFTGGLDKTTSINEEIIDFYKKTVTNFAYSLRVGLSLQRRNSLSKVKNFSFDMHYVYYFNSFDSGITAAARGLSFSLKKQF